MAARSSDAARYLVGAGARALIERGFALAGASFGIAEADRLVKEFLAHYEVTLLMRRVCFPAWKTH
jgi:phosphoglycolate phosphatase